MKDLFLSSVISNSGKGIVVELSSSLPTKSSNKDVLNCLLVVDVSSPAPELDISPDAEPDPDTDTISPGREPDRDTLSFGPEPDVCAGALVPEPHPWYSLRDLDEN